MRYSRHLEGAEAEPKRAPGSTNRTLMAVPLDNADGFGFRCRRCCVEVAAPGSGECADYRNDEA